MVTNDLKQEIMRHISGLNRGQFSAFVRGERQKCLTYCVHQGLAALNQCQLEVRVLSLGVRALSKEV